MANPSKRKGTGFEVAVRDFFRANGFPDCERLPSEGSKDRGDLVGIDSDWIFECKAEKRIDLSGYMREAEAEANNAGASCWAAIVKRPRAGVSDAYAVLPLWALVELIKELQDKEAAA